MLPCRLVSRNWEVIAFVVGSIAFSPDNDIDPAMFEVRYKRLYDLCYQDLSCVTVSSSSAYDQCDGVVHQASLVHVANLGHRGFCMPA